MLIERVTPFLLIWVLRSIVLFKEWAHVISVMIIAEPWWLEMNLFFLIFVMYTLVACSETVKEFNHMIASLRVQRHGDLPPPPPPADTSLGDEETH